jgi:vacuolar-type H+-ATPase subunit I/STV1
MFGLGIKIYSGEDLPLKESDFLTEEEKVLAEKEKEKNKEKEKLDRIIKVAKERVEKYFEDPENEAAIKGQIFPAINFNPKSKHC